MTWPSKQPPGEQHEGNYHQQLQEATNDIPKDESRKEEKKEPGAKNISSYNADDINGYYDAKKSLYWGQFKNYSDVTPDNKLPFAINKDSAESNCKGDVVAEDNIGSNIEEVIGRYIVEEDNMSDGNDAEDEEHAVIESGIEDVADGKIKDNVDVDAEAAAIPTS